MYEALELTFLHPKSSETTLILEQLCDYLLYDVHMVIYMQKSHFQAKISCSSESHNNVKLNNLI